MFIFALAALHVYDLGKILGSQIFLEALIEWDVFIFTYDNF